jgi:Ca2+-binding RTX toxin-like protein
LENTNADNLSPIVDALYSDGWSINSDNKPIIEFELQASDIGSGLKVDDVIIELLSPSGTSIQKRSDFNDGQSSFSISLSKFAASGDYRVNTIRLYDNAGNSTLGYDYINANDTIYTLDNPNSDNEGPILKSFELSAVFDESAQRPIIKIKGSALDDVSGLKNVYLRLERPGGGNLDKWITERASEPGLAVFDNQVPLTTQFISGEYIVNFLILTDIAGNEVTLNGNEVGSLNSTSSSSISVFFPSEIDIAEQNVIIEGTSKKDFVFGTDLTDDVLFSSGGNDYIYSGDGNDDVDAGPGDDIIVGGSGAGNDNYAGGEGVDKVIYSSAINSIYVDLYNKIAMGSDIDNDVLSGIENIQSGSGSDVLRGDEQSNSIWGGEGNDVFVEQKVQTNLMAK